MEAPLKHRSYIPQKAVCSGLTPYMMGSTWSFKNDVCWHKRAGLSIHTGQSRLERSIRFYDLPLTSSLEARYSSALSPMALSGGQKTYTSCVYKRGSLGMQGHVTRIHLISQSDARSIETRPGEIEQTVPCSDSEGPRATNAGPTARDLCCMHQVCGRTSCVRGLQMPTS